MFIQKIILNNFRNFKGTHEFEFDKLNLITGNVGSGKSTLARIAVSFVLYGVSEVAVATLPTRGKEKTCEVEIIFSKNGNTISIKREFPTKVTIKVNNEEQLENATTPDKEKWIIKRFGDLAYFRRYRMIDMSQGVNILDEGPTALKRTLIHFHEQALNNIKTRLKEKKNLFDKYNKDKLLIFKHFPSNKRLKILNESIAYNIQETNRISIDKRNLESKSYNSSSSLSIEKSNINELNKNFKSINEDSTCPLCKRSVDFENKHEILKDLTNQLKEAQSKIKEYSEMFNEDKNNVFLCEQNLQKLRNINQRISYYKQRLEARLKQNEYKYTDRDILIVNKAIKYLDQFYNHFIIAQVKTLEPIINSIISKIDFKAEFRLDNSRNFNIVLLKDDKEFIYKDLSSGQRLLLSIAFQIAMLIEKGDISFIIADEGFNNLDAESVNMLFALLNDLPFQVISILHRLNEIPHNVKNINLGDTSVRQIQEIV